MNKLGAIPARLQASGDAMGTTFSIILYGHDPEQMEEAVAAAFAEARRLDALLSNYRPDSQWSLVNRRAALEPVHVSDELFRILADCLEFSRLTEGAFDITVGALKRAWGLYRGDGRIPSDHELALACGRTGYRLVKLNAEDRTVQFDRQFLEIDPGGIGKGIAVDRMAGLLKQRGFDTALVAGSASSLLGIGAPPTEPRGWRADVRHPEHPRQSIGHRYLRDMALSTSGTGEKYFWSEEGTCSHIVDPRTGRALREISQVSVACPSAVEGEVWAKACLINGRDWAAKHKSAGHQILFSSDDTPAWI